MKSPMLFSVLTFSLLSLIGSATASAAEHPNRAATPQRQMQKQRAQKPRDGSVTTTTHHADGTTSTRTVTTDVDHENHRLSRDISVTNGQGETMTRHTDVVRDGGTVTRTTSGTNFHGEAISSSATTTRTDTGSVRDVTRVNGNGDTVTQHGETVRNGDGSWTRTTTVTDANGVVHTRTVTGHQDENGNIVRDITRK